MTEFVQIVRLELQSDDPDKIDDYVEQLDDTDDVSVHTETIDFMEV